MNPRFVRIEDIEQAERARFDAEFVEEHGPEATWTVDEWHAYQQCMDATGVLSFPEVAA
ncbi:hypothetical protein OG229_02785 [Streptomyces platensis]|uniref:hypothetical protein n=1 Tax=Streptomyces platensis TaxID=58346 RepID=UPI002E0F1CAB|nr:hypothetical protein OG229_02785 [Streptomyces platensis]